MAWHNVVDIESNLSLAGVFSTVLGIRTFCVTLEVLITLDLPLLLTTSTLLTGHLTALKTHPIIKKSMISHY